MIIEKPDETDSDIRHVTWKFNNEDQEYLTDWYVCDNPYCDCAEMSMGIMTGPDTKPVATFNFDAVAMQANVIEADKANRTLSERLISELSSEDIDTLCRIFRSCKAMNIEQVDGAQIDPPAFSVHDIEKESLMVNFRDVFPWCETYGFELDGTIYEVFDQYCLKTNCDCNVGTLVFMGTRNNVLINQNNPTLIKYECDTGKWEITDSGKNAPPPSSLMKELSRQHPDVHASLKKRRETLLLLYKRYCKKMKIRETPAISQKQPQTTGRNEPCPCGSGKKYKKCCGDKS